MNQRKMRYKKLLIFLLIFQLLAIAALICDSCIEAAAEAKADAGKRVIPGGFTIGIYVETKGVLVLGTQAVTGQDGLNYEPAKNILQSGDYIVKVGDEIVDSKKELIEILNQNKDKAAVFGLLREGTPLEVKIKPVQSKDDNSYKIGAWVRDNTQGLGTMTYIDANQFAALGHGISDMDTEMKMEIKGGSLYKADVTAIQKGKKGEPGEIVGNITYSALNKIGEIKNNTKYGIYGTLDITNIENINLQTVPVAGRGEIKKGKAYIRSYIDGSCKDYEIQITKLDKSDKNVLKGMKIIIKDKRLLQKTNGIVQGMSGSPILQNGKLVGAVTHVFVNDPTKGYGILIENMLEQQEISQKSS